MSDGLTEGSRMSGEHDAWVAFYRELAACLESGGSIRRRRGLREATASLDDHLRLPENHGYAARLATIVARLRAGEREIWHQHLQRAFECGDAAVYDCLLALSPFRGMTLLFVEHWRSGNVNLSGPFVSALAERLRQHRQHNDEYREQFLLALADLKEIEPHQVSRLPRANEK